MKGFTTSIVHSDRRDTIEHGSLHKPVHATVAYGYEKTADLAGVFEQVSDPEKIEINAIWHNLNIPIRNGRF